MVRRPTSAQSLYLFCLSSTGWFALAFVPLLVGASVMGLLRDALPLGLGVALSVPGLIAAVVLIDTEGRPRYLLRPRSFLAGVLGYWFIGVLAAAITVQIVMVLTMIDIDRLLALTGLSRDVVASFSTLAKGVEQDAVMLGTIILAMGYPALTTTIAAFMAPFLRFDPPGCDDAAGTQRTNPRSSTRTTEHEAAVRALRIRLAQQQHQLRG
jgi:hypothetical protein